MKISELEKGNSVNTSITLPLALMKFVKQMCDRQNESLSRKVKRFLLSEIEQMPIKEVAEIAEESQVNK